MTYFDESDLIAEIINLNILEQEASNYEDKLSIADFGIVDIIIEDTKLKIIKLTIEENQRHYAEYTRYIQKKEKKERRKNARLNSSRISKGEKNYDKYGY